MILTPDEQRRSRSSRSVLIIGGLLTGMAIGLFSVLSIFYDDVAASPCVSATTNGACTWIGGPTDACQWNSHRQICNTDIMGRLCLVYGAENETTCANLTHAWSIETGTRHDNISCKWSTRVGSSSSYSSSSSSSGVCLDAAPAPKAAQWSGTENGLIASMMILGGFVSSFAARRYVAGGLQEVVRALQVVGLFSLASSGFFIGSWIPTQPFSARLGLVVTGRFLGGLVLGSASVFCTLFNAANSPSKAEVTKNSVWFQISTAGGIALAALVGLIVKRREGEMISDGMLSRFQAVFVLNAVLSLLLCALPWIVSVKQYDDDEEGEQGGASEQRRQQRDVEGSKNIVIVNSKSGGGSFQNPVSVSGAGGQEKVGETTEQTKHQRSEEITPLRTSPNNNQIDGQLEAAAGGWETWKIFFREPKFVVAGLVLATCQVWNGINVMMSYSSAISVQVGLEQMSGNFFIMLFNWIFSIVAIPTTRFALSRGLEARTIYIAGTFGTGASNLLSGIVSLPGVVQDDNARHGLTLFFIGCFFVCFQLTLGPHFYSTLVTLFPSRAVKSATAWTLGIHWISTLILLFSFPAMMATFGGVVGGIPATSEQKQRGFAACFLMFSGINLVAAFVLLKIFKVLREGEEEEEVVVVVMDDGEEKVGS